MKGCWIALASNKEFQQMLLPAAYWVYHLYLE